MRFVSIVVSFILLLSAAAFAAERPESFADLAERSSPAVVNISTTQKIEVARNPLRRLFPRDVPQESPFPDFFEHFYGLENDDEKQEREATSLGSGFIISKDGYVVTNHHVIEGADEITITFSDDRTAKANIIGSDAKTDIALLKIEDERNLSVLKWGDSDKARVGDWVVAIGNPFGLGGSVSAGIISARARDINAGPFDDFIQTDAAINRGNSGGPLLNTEGEVIGVNTAIFSPSGGNVGIGFATPSALIWPVIEQLKKYGKAKRGWLGVKIQTVTDEIAESIGLDKAKGALVVEVTEDSPADRAGILAGDVITRFDQKTVTQMRKLPRIVAETTIGKKVPVMVWRKNKQKTLLVTVAELEEEEDLAQSDTDQEEKGNAKEEKGEKILGMRLLALDKETRKRYRLDKDIAGLVINHVEKESDARDKGLRSGDVIVAVNQEDVTTIKQLKMALTKARKAKRKSVLLLVDRKGDTRFVTVTVGAGS